MSFIVGVLLIATLATFFIVTYYLNKKMDTNSNYRLNECKTCTYKNGSCKNRGV